VILRKRKERRKKERTQTDTNKNKNKNKKAKEQKDKGTQGHRNKGRKANKRNREKTYLPDFPVPLLAHDFQKERNEGPESVDGEEGTAKEVAEYAKPGD
jgi:hypothetical protein